MLNFGVRAHDFGKQDIESLSSKISNMGFNSIQLALKKAVKGIDNLDGILSPGFGNYTRDTFKNNNVNISVLGCYINPVHQDKNRRDSEIKNFINHIKFANSFGCSIVGTETGNNSETNSEKTFSTFIESLEILVETAEKFGVIVAIEGVADKDTIYSHKRMERVLELIPSPNLGIIYDPVNFLPNKYLNSSDELMKEAFDMFSNKMVAIHAKDYIITNGKKDGTIPSGKGLLNYELLFDLIKTNKPYIDILLENNTPESIESSLNFVKKVGGVL